MRGHHALLTTLALTAQRQPPAMRLRLVRSCRMDAVSDAERLLAEYDANHRAAAASAGASGLGGALTANAWAVSADRAPLAAAVKAMRLAAMPSNGRIMLGICAQDASEGLAALKAWVSRLHLPRGVLHGMDRDGVPLDMSEFGSVYIKYNSHASSAGDPPGTATLSGYNGDFRGVYFNPDLQDGNFRQFAVLPLDLFGELPGAATVGAESPAASATSAASAASAASTVPLAVGMRVLVRYGGKAAEYPGTLMASPAKDVWDVTYDDGDREVGVRAELIRPRSAPAAAQAATAPAPSAAAAAAAAAASGGGRAVSVSAAGAASRSRAVAVAGEAAAEAAVVEARENPVLKEMAAAAAEAEEAEASSYNFEGTRSTPAVPITTPDMPITTPKMPSTTPAVPSRFSSTRRFIAREAEAEVEDETEATASDVLHRQGWYLLRRAHVVDETVVSAIRASRFQPIFNGHAPGEAPLRHMGRDARAWATQLEGVFSAVLGEAGLLACSDGVSSKVVRDCYALRSLPLPGLRARAEEGAVAGADGDGAVAGADGLRARAEEDEARAALEGRQPAHSDSPEPLPPSSLADIADADFPLSALLAVQPMTKLWIFPNGCDDPNPMLLRLAVGDMLVWRGDLVHAGAGYAEEHVRVHAYVDPPSHIYQRPFGKTNRCGL